MHVIVFSSSQFPKVPRIIFQWIPKWIQIVKFSGPLWDFGESQVGVLIIDDVGWGREKKKDFYFWH